jgi:hypothetical protein
MSHREDYSFLLSLRAGRPAFDSRQVREGFFFLFASNFRVKMKAGLDFVLLKH